VHVKLIPVINNPTTKNYHIMDEIKINQLKIKWTIPGFIRIVIKPGV